MVGGGGARGGGGNAAAFAGEWEDDDGTLVTIRAGQVHGPFGIRAKLVVKTETECSFEMGGKLYEGRLRDDGRLVWDDGSMWENKGSSGAAAASATGRPRIAHEEQIIARRQAAQERARKAMEQQHQRSPDSQDDEAQKADEDARLRNLDGHNRGKQAQEAERTRRQAALERLRKDREEVQQPDRPDKNDAATKAFEEAKARSKAGQDRAKQAMEAERAKRQAAQERARKSKEQEQAKKAEEDGRQRGLTEQAKTASVQELPRADMDEARAKREAARERARKAKDNVGSSPTSWGPGGSSAFEELRQRSQAGQDKSRSAMEAEKARREAAQARVRAAREQGLAARRGGGDYPSFGASPLSGMGGRRSFGRDYSNFGRPKAQPMGEYVQGLLVRLEGLIARPELNGEMGILVAFDQIKGRWQVQLDHASEMVLLKEANLAPVNAEGVDGSQDDEDDDSGMPATLFCPVGHCMKREEAAAVYECDVCFEDVPVGTRIFYCEKCDHVTCETCSTNQFQDDERGDNADPLLSVD